MPLASPLLFPRALAAAAIGLFLMAMTASGAGRDGLEGRWQGFMPLPDQPTRFELVVRANEGAALTAQIAMPDLGLLTDEVAIRFEGDTTFEASFQAGELEGSWAPGSDQLTVHVTPNAGQQATLQLEQHHPEFKTYDTPRTGPDGELVTNYRYARPPVSDDWPVADAAAEGLATEGLEKLVESVLRGEAGRVEALLVARRGKLILEEYFFAHGRDDLHTIQSISKSVTSLVLGAVVDDHDLDLDTAVYRILSHREDTEWVKQRYPISIYHLLTMTAGIEWNEELPYTNPQNSNTAMNASSDWIGFVLNRPLGRGPGGVSRYTSGLTILLGEVIRQRTGEHVDRLAERKLFGPLGIDRYRWSASARGVKHTGGGLSLRSVDLLKIGQLVLQQGRWEGRSIVPQGYLSESIRRVPLAAAPERETIGYGYQWWLRQYEVGGTGIHAVLGLGYGGQYLGVFPSLDLVMVMNASQYLSDERFDMDRVVSIVLASASAR